MSEKKKTAIIVFSNGSDPIACYPEDVDYWLNRRRSYGIERVVIGEEYDFQSVLDEWKRKEAAEERAEQERQERREYDRLKAKFESDHG